MTAWYPEILQDTYLVALLPACEAKLRVKKRKHPKLQGERPFDTPDGIEALPVMHFTEELLAGRL